MSLKLILHVPSEPSLVSNLWRIFNFLDSVIHLLSYLLIYLATFIEPIIWPRFYSHTRDIILIKLLLLFFRTSWGEQTQINSPRWIQEITKAHQREGTSERTTTSLEKSGSAVFTDCLSCARHSSKWFTFIHFTFTTTLCSRYYYYTHFINEA